MKIRLLLLLFSVCSVCSVGALSGCSTVDGGGDAAFVQRILDQSLPRSFQGDFSVKHRNSWIDANLEFTGLRFDGTAWQWESLLWVRGGRFSSGTIVQTPRR